MNWSRDELDLLEAAAQALQSGFRDLPETADSADLSRWGEVLQRAATMLQDNDPYFHPLYCGQMLKPPHPVARMAYALAMLINPNNHALDGGRASSAMEREVTAKLAAMCGWIATSDDESPPFLGHLCGGGTLANFEALWVARELTGGKTIVASQQAHYTHGRLSGVLQNSFEAIAVDSRGRMDLAVLEDRLQRGDVGTVVATLGTTALGAVDPLDEIVVLQQRYPFRLHVDAAYGGYFTLADNLRPETRAAFDVICAADSIVIDPHKHGLQPYGCGCVLFRDPSVARLYLHDSPYTYYTSDELHLGEISLECSRAGASAVALWATLQLLPLERGGEFTQGLEAGRTAALALFQWLQQSDCFVPLLEPELDIVVWGVRAASASESSQQARALFQQARQHQVYLALATIPRSLGETKGIVTHWDQDTITCLRSVLMKPEHREWMPEIITRLQRATGEIG